MNIPGKVVRVGQYADGVPRFEIHFRREFFADLSAVSNNRKEFSLDVCGVVYVAGIRHTNNCPYLWVCPDCRFEGAKTRLADVLINVGYSANDPLEIDVNDTPFRLKTGEEQTGIYEPGEYAKPDRYFEGAVKKIYVNSFERNQAARNQCVRHYGTTCWICGFDFGKVYGPDASGFIHVHHIYPLSQLSDQYEVDPIKDLIPVCPNCHAYIHLGEGCKNVSAVKNALNNIDH